MKRNLILLAVLLLCTACHSDDVSIRTSSGTLILSPLADNAVRVRLAGEPTHAVEELIFTENVEHPRFSRREDAGSLTLDLKGIRVVYDKQTETLSYYDRDGKLLVQEQPGSRLLGKSMITGDPIPATSTNGAALPQLYGGTVDDPIPVYAESDELLEALFPKGKTIFLMCQSGGRVNNMMKLLAARGWDMSKIYNIGGMAHYAGAEYRDIVTDTPEIAINATYSFEGLTRIAPK